MSRVDVIFKVVHLILMITAVVGLVIFAAGFGIFYKKLSPSDAALPAVIGVSWTSVLSPMILFGASSIPIYIVAIVRIFSRGRPEKILSAIILVLDFFYMLGMSTTLFILALMLVGGLGDYLKNIFLLTNNNILVMTIGCLLSVLAYRVHIVIWPLSNMRKKQSPYMYQELAQN